MDKKSHEQFKAHTDFLIRMSEKCNNCRYRGYKTQNKTQCRYHTVDCNTLITAIVDKKLSLGGYAHIPIVYQYKMLVKKIRNHIIKQRMTLKSRIKVTFHNAINFIKCI